jgi:hypothetical protein
MMIQGGQASPMKNWGCIDHAKKVAGNRGADMGYIPTYGGYIYIYIYTAFVGHYCKTMVTPTSHKHMIVNNPFSLILNWAAP